MISLRRFRSPFLILTALVVVASGCGFTTNEESEQLVGSWMLVSMSKDGVAQETAAELSATSITFLGDGRFEGQAPCNDFAGLWSHTSAGLGVSGLSQSAAACVAPDGGQALMDAERLIMSALFEAGRFGMLREDDTLELSARGYRLTWVVLA